MQIAVIGVGFVGGALVNWLEKNTNHTIKKLDPAKGFNDSLIGSDATFICVPVPTVKNQQDLSILESVMDFAFGKVFIRSTVLPGTNDTFDTYSCPEFLSERTANEDMDRLNIITGYQDQGFIEDIFPGKQILRMTNKECELAKYSHNAFGAVKVNFFNLIWRIARTLECDYEKVLEGVLMSGYINKPHTQVPGHDGLFGFGGTCFPKDLKAFHGMFPRLTFESCLHENEVHRSSK